MGPTGGHPGGTACRNGRERGVVGIGFEDPKIPATGPVGIGRVRTGPPACGSSYRPIAEPLPILKMSSPEKVVLDPIGKLVSLEKRHSVLDSNLCVRTRNRGSGCSEEFYAVSLFIRLKGICI